MSSRPRSWKLLTFAVRSIRSGRYWWVSRSKTLILPAFSATNITGESPDSAEAGASPQSPLVTAAELRPPAFTYILASGENDASYSFTSAASVIGHTYRLQTIDDLATGTWTDLSEPVAGTGAVIGFTTPYNPIDPRRFYRILISR